MRDIPMFTTEFGVASLILESVPHRQEAFVHIRSTEAPEKLLRECRDFCIACGAERIYAAGDGIPEKYPLYMEILQMSGRTDAVGETDAALFPVQEETGEMWRKIYNEKMAQVPKAAYLTTFSMQSLIREGHAYFVHRQGALLGIGVVDGDQIRALASVMPGQGAEVLRALCHALSEPIFSVEVSSTNHRAMALYQKLGLLPTRAISRWYKIYG